MTLQTDIDFLSDLIDGIIDERKYDIPSEYIETVRYLPKGSSPKPGFFEFDYTPYLREPFDLLAPDSGIERIIFMKPAQIGYTIGYLQNAVLYHIGSNPKRVQFVTADNQLAEETVGRPYADAMRKIYQRYPGDAEVSYFFAESLMVLNAWNLYEYPTGRPLSGDVKEIQNVLEKALQLHPNHAGICHLYVHLCEMSSHPEKALPACKALRTE